MPEDKRLEDAIAQITRKMDTLISDMAVPKNVRAAISEARASLMKSGDYTVRISGAIYSIDRISTDINLPPQARTVVWNLLSDLESIKEQEP